MGGRRRPMLVAGDADPLAPPLSASRTGRLVLLFEGRSAGLLVGAKSEERVVFVKDPYAPSAAAGIAGRRLRLSQGVGRRGGIAARQPRQCEIAHQGRIFELVNYWGVDQSPCGISGKSSDLIVQGRDASDVAQRHCVRMAYQLGESAKFDRARGIADIAAVGAAAIPPRCGPQPGRAATRRPAMPPPPRARRGP